MTTYITVYKFIYIFIAEFCFGVINTFCPVLQFVTVTLSHRIITCTFTNVLFLPNLVSAVPSAYHHIIETCILSLCSLYFNNSHFSQNNSTMARTKPQGKKKMGTSKAKAPAKQGQDNWFSSCQVLAVAAAAAAAAPVAAPTTDAVIPPAGSWWILMFWT
jgi:hypothetical protein